MFGKKQIVITPLKQDVEPRVVRFPEKPPNPESATKLKVSFQRPNPISTLNVTSPRSRITPQFAYDLLMAEMELQTTDNLQKDVAMRLFELYKTGIEHYNSRQNAKKQAFFKKKLDNFTNHPAVLGMLHAQKQNEDTFYKKKQIERLVEINRESSESVEHMIKRIENVEVRNKQTIEKNISAQMDEIRKRIEKRKMASRPTSTKDEANDNRDHDFPSPPISLRNKVSINKKGSVSFAQADIKDGQNYDQLFVQKYHDDS